MVAEAKSRTFCLKVWGAYACFTRPEMKVERVSYDVMTPSAARGILEAILWKPAIRWQVSRIDVLNPIRWASVRRNEVGAVMSRAPKASLSRTQRQQRAGLFLRDVAIHPRLFEMTAKVGAEDNVKKFEEMFIRRAEKGQCFHRPISAAGRFAADFELWPPQAPEPRASDESRDLGFMLYDISHDQSSDKNHTHTCTDGCRPCFFRASLDRGMMKVPNIDSEEVRR